MAADAGLVLAPGSHSLILLVPYALVLPQMTDPRPEGTSTCLTLLFFNFWISFWCIVWAYSSPEEWSLAMGPRG